uniref:Uncharacterized protein n=1 Tax=Chromera velia CCMP2878 TaxID=1169474 RepID=A0A0G4IG45_9ALVE|eukprot:Cvel_2524.t1-p1 / transcript=Cvel_2524.t1 / gene=Cvel_2524 / organism=Chromera_velia_CCMP2878 / gene_product=hypothetical protein / transcript_product=hypothetical protein / location=Cvel_scaffold99:117741-118532(+) / protein_length=264 / sequence_SO=supercontig / SO=protein_coding / is_pseudo=false
MVDHRGSLSGGPVSSKLAWFNFTRREPGMQSFSEERAAGYLAEGVCAALAQEAVVWLRDLSKAALTHANRESLLDTPIPPPLMMIFGKCTKARDLGPGLLPRRRHGHQTGSAGGREGAAAAVPAAAAASTEGGGGGNLKGLLHETIFSFTHYWQLPSYYEQEYWNKHEDRFLGLWAVPFPRGSAIVHGDQTGGLKRGVEHPDDEDIDHEIGFLRANCAECDMYISRRADRVIILQLPESARVENGSVLYYKYHEMSLMQELREI